MLSVVCTLSTCMSPTCVLTVKQLFVHDLILAGTESNAICFSSSQLVYKRRWFLADGKYLHFVLLFSDAMTTCHESDNVTLNHSMLLFIIYI